MPLPALIQRRGFALVAGVALSAFAACSPAAPKAEPAPTAAATPAAAPTPSPAPLATATPPADATPAADAAQGGADMAVHRGAALARQVCVQCHDIGVPGAGPTMQIGAPTFPNVANSEGATAASLEQWMRTSHPTMPTYMFNDSSVTDLAAYIMSLHKPD